jgi:hypothetical protein
MLHREKEITSNLIRSALAHGWTVSVCNDGIGGEGEWTVKRSTDFKTIFDALDTTCSDMLRFRDKDGTSKGWAVLIWGNDDCLVSDYSWNLDIEEDGNIFGLKAA